MKKRDQIESQRAVKRLEEIAADGGGTGQLELPLAEMVGWLRQGVGELIRPANRWGTEPGYCVVMGPKVPITRPRVRGVDDREVRLGSYELFPRGAPLTAAVWSKLMWGLSTRQYGQAVRQFMEAYGLEKSAVSEHFIEASRTKLKELMERRLEKKNFCARLIDGTPFVGQLMIAALGIGQDGRKTIWGIRQGASENATVVSELLDDLAARGFDFSPPRLYVLDGGKTLPVAVRRHAGEAALIQRCQAHKRRNVLDHLPEDQRPLVAKQLNTAYAMADYAPAKPALDRLHRELMDVNPRAARRLAEGLEETLTVHRLRVPRLRRQTWASTNVIASAFAVVEKVWANVKRWHPGDQRERWVGAGLLVAENHFRRVKGYLLIPRLLREFATFTPPKTTVRSHLCFIQTLSRYPPPATAKSGSPAILTRRAS